jgi:hypothetical protein
MAHRGTKKHHCATKSAVKKPKNPQMPHVPQKPLPSVPLRGVFWCFCPKYHVRNPPKTHPLSRPVFPQFHHHGQNFRNRFIQLDGDRLIQFHLRI